jgi:steroid delta-isomerase
MADSNAISAEHIQRVFQRYVDLVTDGDIDGIVELYAADATIEDPIGSPVHRGRDAIRAFYEASRGSVRMALEGRVRTAGNEGAAAMTAQPTGGSSIVIETLDTMAFDGDGRITSMRAYWSPNTIRRE